MVDTGEIPEPTVIVRTREDIQHYSRVMPRFFRGFFMAEYGEDNNEHQNYDSR